MILCEYALIEIISERGDVGIIKFSFTLYLVKDCHVDFTVNPMMDNGK